MDNMQDMKCLVCLSCLVEEKVYHSLTSSFPGFLSTQSTVLGVLQIVSNRKIKLAKEWPDQICTSCLKELKDAYKFIQQLLTSLAHLKSKSKELKARLKESVSLVDLYQPQVIIKEYKAETIEDIDPLLIESCNEESKTASSNHASNETIHDPSEYILEIDPCSSDLLIPLYSEPVDPPEIKITPRRQRRSTKGKARRKAKAKTTAKKRGAKKSNTNVLVEVGEEQGSEKSNSNVLVEVVKAGQEPNIALLEHNYTRSSDFPPQNFELYSDEEISVPNTPEKFGKEINIPEIEYVPYTPEKWEKDINIPEIEHLPNTPEKWEKDINIPEIEHVPNTPEKWEKDINIPEIEQLELSSAENNSFKEIENTDMVTFPVTPPVRSVSSKPKKPSKLSKKLPKKPGGIIMMSVEDVLKLKKRKRKMKGLTSAASEAASEAAPEAASEAAPEAASNASSFEAKEEQNHNQTENVTEPDKPYQCDFCTKKFGSTKGVTLHIKYAHSKEYLSTKLKCADCDLTFRTKSAWTYHRNKFHSKTVNKCEQCSKEFPTRHALNEHQNRVHGDLPENYMCNECGKMFKYANALQYHLVSVHNRGEIQHLCKFCGYRAITKSLLKNHETIHSEDRPFKCQSCPNTYKRSSDLLYHNMKIHERKSLHHCKFCGKGFIKMWNMRMHWLQHEGSHKCTICPKAFKDEDILNFHYKYNHRDVVTVAYTETENIEKDEEYDVDYEQWNG